MVQVSNVFGASDTIVAADVNENFDDLEAAVSALDTSNLAEDAGIRATQLADRYAVWHDSFWLVPPINSGATALIREGNTTAGLLVYEAGDTDGTFYTLLTQNVTFDGAQEVYLCEVELRLANRSANTQFRMQINGVTVGGSAVTLDTDAAFYRLRSPSPIDDPVFAVQDGDVITFDLAAVDTAADVLRGLFVRLTWKSRINN
jgi:hypothetical protein